jgi:hypothetical protein
MSSIPSHQLLKTSCFAVLPEISRNKHNKKQQLPAYDFRFLYYEFRAHLKSQSINNQDLTRDSQKLALHQEGRNSQSP